MKKIIALLYPVFIILMPLSAQYAENDAEIKFIKGNIQDKIECVKDTGNDSSSKIAVKALDFILENLVLLQDDRDFASLSVASILAYPVLEFENEPVLTVQKFAAVFYRLKDENVRISTLEKIMTLSKNLKNDEAVKFVNTYLYSAMQDKIRYTAVEQKAIQVLSQIGNDESFLILYQAIKNNVWNDASVELRNSILNLAENSARQINEIIAKADFKEMELIYSIFLKNSQISSSFKSEMAENLLTNSMIIVRDSSKISKEISDFQLNNCKILYDNNWTRSSELVCSYFEVAKSQFTAGFLTEEEFCQVIKYVEKISSKDSVSIFTRYLGELNKEMDNGNLPAVNIVSALIQSLGALGDKSAFDCLLYTTYLNYPENIVAQARSALSRLKW